MAFQRGGDVYLEQNACKVTLTRGQRGSYGWEVKYESNDVESVLAEIKKADTMLCAQYAVQEGGED